MSDILQTILERAEYRFAQSDSDTPFLHALTSEVADILSLSRLTLWELQSETVSMLCSAGPVTVAAPDAEQLRAMAPGELRNLNAEDSSGNRVWVATDVSNNIRLVLDADAKQDTADPQLLQQLTDVFADLRRRELVDQMAQNKEDQRDWQALVLQLHSSLDSRTIANTIATDAGGLLDAQRIAVAQRTGRTWDVVATTGVSRPNDRSDASRQIVESIRSAAAAKEHESADRNLVFPLHASQEWPSAEWAMVVETGTSFRQPELAKQLVRHATSAFENSRNSEQNSLTQRLRRGLRQLSRPRAISTILALVGLVAVLTLMKTELRIEAYGELVPAERRYVFAPDDGTITALAVEDGTQVTVDEVLCVVTNEDLNGQQESIAGDLAAANARLAAIDALRSAGRNDAAEARLLSAEQAELQEKVKSLTRQSLIVEERLAQLQVKSRMDGRVYGDRLRQLLFLRPVVRGQYLFEVADPSAGWQLEVRVPEADVRYVLHATQGADTRPRVTFALQTSPDMTHETELTSLGTSTDVDPSGQLSTLAIATLNEIGLHADRPGAGVVARIHCGQRSVGFVWFRQLIEFVQRHTWL